MQYNFESIADTLIEKFDKKLASTQKECEKQMGILFTFLSDRIPFEQRKNLEQTVSDIMADRNKSQAAVFTETMHKIVRAIREVIKE